MAPLMLRGAVCGALLSVAGGVNLRRGEVELHRVANETKPRMDVDNEWHKEMGKGLADDHNIDTKDGMTNKTSSSSIRNRTDSDLVRPKSALLHFANETNGSKGPRMDVDNEWHKEMGKGLADDHNIDTKGGMTNKTSSSSIRNRTDSDLVRPKSALIVNSTKEAPRMDQDHEWHKDLGKTLKEKHNVDTPEGQNNETSSDSIRNRTDTDLAMDKKNDTALLLVAQIDRLVNGTEEEGPRMDEDDEWHKDLGKGLKPEHNVDTPEGQANDTSSDSVRDRTEEDLAPEE